jgi:EAL domain-containing protein (putative c-di-GMP-specific phosphodiesterase class I)
VQAIIALGKAMGLEVIAEGVETEMQLLLVNQFGCDLAQGYFIGMPMHEKAFLEWCEAVEQTTSDLQALPAGFVKILSAR